MRAKRSKKYRKIMGQYGLTFGFREPYQVLVDSNHLRTLHAFKMPLNQYLENTLHGKVKPFVTRCTLASILQTTDLHTNQRPDFLPSPKELPLRHCSHAGGIEGGEEGVLPEQECLLDLLSGGVTGNQLARNKQHFVLATADPFPVNHGKNQVLRKERGPPSAAGGRDIRAQARAIPGVPIIYVKRSVMVLEELSGASLGFRRREEKDKFREGLIGTGSRKRKRDEEQGRDDDGKKAMKEGDAGEPRKKKMKKVRGPNPLSVLKKKPKPKTQQPQGPAIVTAKAASPNVHDALPAEGQPKAKRKRKHAKKSNPDANDVAHQTISEDKEEG